MSQEHNTPAWLNKLGETYSQVHLGPGVMGKTTRATLGLIALWGLVLFRISSDVWMNGFLAGGACIATAVYIWWVNKSHKFAEAHPDIALLEGAQFIEYQKWEAEIQGKIVPRFPLIPDPQAKATEVIDENEQEKQ